MSEHAHIHDHKDYIVPASDAKGHGVNFQFRCLSQYQRRMRLIVESRRFPFKSISDVLRWCLKHGIEDLERLKGEINLGQFHAIDDVLAEIEQQQQFDALLDRVEKAITFALKKGNMGAARHVYARLRHQFETMPDNGWRDTYLRLLNDKWGHLSQGPGVKLNAGAPEPEPTRVIGGEGL